jgi:hypothetical protein
MENLDIEKLKNYINDLEEQITPLTKKSTTRQKLPANPEMTEEINQQEDIQEKPKKPKKPYNVSDKKMMALEMAREKKNANHALRVKQKKLESAKLLLENELVQPKKAPVVKAVKQKIIQEESESEEEPQVIYIKKPKKKPAKKPIIIQEDDSSSSGGSEESDPLPVKLKSFGKSHKNKKSVVKIHKQEDKPQPQIPQPKQFVNYFCD